MMYTVKARVDFEAAHRLYNANTYAEECRKNLHGHSYKVDVEISSTGLNNANMIIDFKLLKEILKSTIHDKYDHACILNQADPLCRAIQAECDKVVIVNSNPSAEWMAQEFYACIYTVLHNRFGDMYDIVSVSVQETENNIAVYKPEEVSK